MPRMGNHISFESNGKIIQQKELQDKTFNMALRRACMFKMIEKNYCSCKERISSWFPDTRSDNVITSVSGSKPRPKCVS
ncbi:hypothetical protein DPMN_078590 [Dreissena polymorpha]|uniref:Uncharacterized protein n=1 Tax=Dreissena polymorpha TaxID=45954 RepID=A0A9D3YQS5_DREPO|nr:hypothetical protein DPMN_078590 [Dreissena polymorpha]